MLIDSHCHLNLLDLNLFDNDLGNVLALAEQKNVKHFICVATDLQRFSELCAIKNKYAQVSISLGLHPNENESTTNNPDVETLVKLAKENQVIAIGETGLDYHYISGEKTWQQDRFRNHIRAAKQLGLPLIIHTREAREDTLRIMREENAAEVGGVMHCFTETWEMAKQAMDLNFYISFSGIVTFKNALELQDVAKKMPSDRMLVETDCPYLAPVPYRGKPNQPAYVHYVAEFLATLRQQSFDVVAEQTTQNCQRLFKIGSAA